MIKEIDYLDVSDCKLIQPMCIIRRKKKIKMVDIVLEKDNTFVIKLNDWLKIYAHNCDGYHITTLIINFFHNWFPQVIENKKLFRLMTPLVACDFNKTRKYFYKQEEFSKFISENKVTNMTYLKGLGSLSLEDWENVMKDKLLFSIIDDKSASKYFDIIFGESTLKRKKWLQGE